MSGFEGFGKPTIKFIRGLSRNNDKAWFEEHRAEYDAHYIAPAKAFVVAVEKSLRKIAPEIECLPKVNGSIFRINRDIRFSKDKTPYKDHLDMWFWEGNRKTALSGFFLRVSPREVIAGAGCHGFDSARLKRFRAAVVDDKAGKALLSAVKKAETKGMTLSEPHYKKLPRGFEATGKRAELLRLKSLAAHTQVKHPAELGTKAFVKWCVDEWKKGAPLHRWLNDHVA